MRVVAIIPARFQSSRFPGKPLVEILGVSLLRRVHARCLLALPKSDVYVATDDERIRLHCEQGGIQVIMTGSHCLTGTDRVHQAAQQIEADLFLNVQGDEPLIDPVDINAVLDACRARPSEVINAMCPIEEKSDFLSTMVPKVVARPDGRLLYMSRAAIPTTKNHEFVRAMKQVCIYGLPRAALAQFAACKRKTPLEQLEDIEILRFLELGYEVRMVQVSGASIAVDTPGDVARVEKALRERA
ncbi:MAG: 3-deoxy-manno-octulosonate cytidylyltransferase [Pseudomonadota bacterium]